MILAMPESIENLLGLQELKKHVYESAITTTVTKPEEFNIYKNTSPFAKEFTTMMDKKKDVKEVSIDNSNYVILTNTINQTNWKLFTVISEKNIFANANKLKKLSNEIGYLAIIIMAIFYFLFFYFLFKKSKDITSAIEQPISKLSRQTSYVGMGEKIDIVETEILELRKLSENFSKMSEELDLKTQKIIEVKLQERKKAKEAEKYHEKSMQDPLTGVYNRMKISEIITASLNLFQSDNSKVFSIIYMDIDHFKTINDTYGHIIGDKVLKDFVTLLKESTRQSDVIGRLGGEEFIIIIEHKLEIARKIAEHLRERIEGEMFYEGLNVTCSFGVAEVKKNDSENSIINRADIAMYQAKKSGRNRVEIHK